MKKQTAVSIIIENFNLLSDNDFKIWFLNSIDKFLPLEKEQIKEAYRYGESNNFYRTEISAKDYYTLTYE